MPEYEQDWYVPADLSMQRLRDRGLNRKALVIARSPWHPADIGTFYRKHLDERAVTVGVNSAGLVWRCNYCVRMDADALAEYDIGHYPDTVFVVPDTDPCKRWAEQWPKARVIWFHLPPELPPELRRFNRLHPRPWGCDTYTVMVATWTAWFMGCSLIFVAGADFKDKAGAVYAPCDSRALARKDDERTRLDYQQKTWPHARQKFAELVAAIRADGVTVEWPGETPRPREV